MTVSVSVRCWVGPMCACMRVPAVLHAYNTAYIHADDACSKGIGVWYQDDGGMGGCMHDVESECECKVLGRRVGMCTGDTARPQYSIYTC